MSFKTFFLLLCGLALNQVLFASAQSDLVVCNVTEPPSLDNPCTLEFNPVCAYYFVCLTPETCRGFTQGNPCQACSQSGYDYYFPGPCEGDGPGNEEEEVITEEGGTEGEGEGETGDGVFWCSSLDFVPTVCTLEYAPVCAYSATEEGASQGVTVGNGCMACLEGYDYYTDGACTEDGEGGEQEGPTEENTEVGPGIVWCDVPDILPQNVSCTLEYDPVCAYRATGEGESAEGVTVGNACQACYQQGFDYYTPGPCEGNGNEETGVEEGNTEENVGEATVEVEELIIVVDEPTNT